MRHPIRFLSLLMLCMMPLSAYADASDTETLRELTALEYPDVRGRGRLQRQQCVVIINDALWLLLHGGGSVCMYVCMYS